MTVKQLRRQSMALCRQKGINSSWVQYSKKRRLLDFIDGKYDPAKDNEDVPSDGGGSKDGTVPSDNGTKGNGGDELDGLGKAIGDYTTKEVLKEMEDKYGDIIDDLIEEKVEEVTKPRVVSVGERVVFDEAKGDLVHFQFQDALDKLVVEQKLFMVGERGTGKSTIAEQLNAVMTEHHNWDKDDKFRYTYVVGTAGVSEAQLLGKTTFDGRYIEGQYVKPFDEGGFIVADEFNGFDPNMALIHNSMLDGQGLLFTPNDPESPYRHRHKDNYFIAVDNANGYGNDFAYVGRNQQDLATLDRFTGSTIDIYYDESIELALVGQYKEIAEALWDLRGRIKTERLNRNVSTRAFSTSSKMVHNAVKGVIAERNVTPIRLGIDDEVAVNVPKASTYYAILDLTAQFTDEEKRKLDIKGFETKYNAIYCDDEPVVVADENSTVTNYISDNTEEEE